ncbi:hypothetical protein M8J76_013619 [Diaphorina citri]|nr:hypothetical protein M8J75_016205 [Diaphorina citri]KAI5716866.1 hypothetical protein M8J76_013619 [Diaphorina citri]
MVSSLVFMLGLVLVCILIGQEVQATGLRSSGRVECGEIVCQEYEFCSSSVDIQCRKCNSICDSKSKNYDVHTCDQFCQDYIHDYVRRYVKKEDVAELESQVERLNRLVGTALVLSILLCIVALLSVLFIWIRYRKLVQKTAIGDDAYQRKLDAVKYISQNHNTNGNGPGASILPSSSTLPQIITVTNATSSLGETAPYGNANNNSHAYGNSNNNSDAYGNSNNNSHAYGNSEHNSHGAYGNSNNNSHAYGNSINSSSHAYGKSGNNSHAYGNSEHNSHGAYGNSEHNSHAYGNSVSRLSHVSNGGHTPLPLKVSIPPDGNSFGGRSSTSPPSTSSTQLCGNLPRYPSEDATLEHAAYDNLAMTPTPPRTAAVVSERY